MTNLILAGLGGCVGAMARVCLSGAIARAMDRAGFWSAFSDRYFLRECAGKLADRVFTRTKFNAEPAGIFCRRRAGWLYDIFYVQLRYAAIIAGARICYRCAKRGLKRMRLYVVLLCWAARGQSTCRLAVEHVSFKFKSPLSLRF